MAIRGGLGLLAGLYDGGLTAYLAAERVGLRRRTHLPIPVVSVGNLSVGGTGKTPMTILLGRMLEAAGLRVAILSRGHGGASHETRVVSSGDGAVLLSPSDAGDEPVLLAASLRNIPVVVGKDRRLSGREAMRRWPLDVVVLDDGFQYWQLFRDLDIVLLDSRYPFENGHPLPRGLLREPARNLGRAGIVVVTRASRLGVDITARERIVSQVKEFTPQAGIYFSDHIASCLVRVDGGDGWTSTQTEDLDHLNGRLVVAVSAIAQPQSFIETLMSATQCQLVAAISRDDHSTFGHNDIADILEKAIGLGAEAIVMTEKDAVKWREASPNLELPVFALRITMKIERQHEFFEEVLKRSGIVAV